jgi:hypothetical protein
LRPGPSRKHPLWWWHFGRTARSTPWPNGRFTPQPACQMRHLGKPLPALTTLVPDESWFPRSRPVRQCGYGTRVRWAFDAPWGCCDDGSDSCLPWARRRPAAHRCGGRALRIRFVGDAHRAVRRGHIRRDGGGPPNDRPRQAMPVITPGTIGQVGYGPASPKDRAHFAPALKASGGLIVSKAVSTLTVSGRDVGGMAVYGTAKSMAMSRVFQDQVRRAAHQTPSPGRNRHHGSSRPTVRS